MKLFAQLLFPVSAKEFADYAITWMIISGITLPIFWLVLNFEQLHIRTFWIFVLTTLGAVAYSYIFRSSNFSKTQLKLSPELMLRSVLPVLILIALLLVTDDYSYSYTHTKIYGFALGLTSIWSSQVAIIIRLIIENIKKKVRE